MKHLNIYFDMDGVLAQYEKNAYNSYNPIALQHGSHYFQTVAPDKRAIDIFRACHNQCNTKILTVLNKEGSLFLEQYNDKRIWLESQSIPSNLLIPVMGEEKCDLITSTINTNLTKDYILIDDFNHNLECWRKAGGLAIKYLNGENSKDSYNGPIIDSRMSTEDVIKMIGILTNINLY